MASYTKGVCKCKDMSEDALVLMEDVGYFESMGGFRTLFHLLLAIGTGGIWLGYLGMQYLIAKDKHQCTQCRRFSKSSALRA